MRILVILVFTGLLLFAGCASLQPYRGVESVGASPSPDSVAADFSSPHETVRLASQWVARADTLLVNGDDVAAEEILIHAVQAVSGALFYLDPVDRHNWMDSLSVWSQRYTESFALPGETIGPGEEGLSAIDMELLEDSVSVLPDTLLAILPDSIAEALSSDSLIGVMVTDTTFVELDTTVSELERLPGIPDTLNALVEDQIRYFTTSERGRKAMSVWLSRSEEMIPRMKRVLRAHNLPEDLVYLSMIESGFRTDARSYAKAVGPWQFIYSTAKIFDLKADWWYDERRDPERATVAAARYLRQLYEHLGDWYLAMAAYNCGEGRVKREIRRSNTRDFWKLRRLPRQTRGYIPTFIAARRIASDPERYGFPAPEYIDPVPRDSVIVTECVDLTALSEVLEVELEELRDLNPAIFRWCTPPTQDTTIVYVPRGKAEDFAAKFAQIPEEKRTSWVRHKVRSGETLSLIANKYRTSMRAIMDVPANRLRSPHKIRKGQYLLIPVAPSGSGYSYASIRDMSEPDVPSGMEKKVHIVRRGETLSEIAEMYHVGLSKLLRWNGKGRNSIIRTGERLVVYRPPGDKRVDSASTSVVSSSSGRYTVKKGDSPWKIAQRYGVSTSDLLAANGLDRKAKIHPGETLIVPGRGEAGSEQAVYHTVQRGDTLWDIAQRYRVSVRELKQWNSISDSRRLSVGDRLVVYLSGGRG